MTGQIVAMDLGTAQAKLVWYAGGRVKKTVAAPLPDQLVSNGVIVSMDAMADFLKQLAKENGIPRTGAAVILPDRLVFTRSTALPPVAITRGVLMSRESIASLSSSRSPETPFFSSVLYSSSPVLF